MIVRNEKFIAGIRSKWIRAFHKRVVAGDPGECWEWRGSLHSGGYGKASKHGKTVCAHRLAWELKNGPIPEGMVVMHKCDNPPCCNPSHLQLGTQADNLADRNQKGRHNSPRGSCHWTHTRRESLARGERHGSRTHPEKILRGERNGSAKLTEAKVAEIRALYAAGDVTQRELGARFGVARRTVGRVVDKKTWKTETPCNSALHALLFGSAQSTTIGEGDYADISPVPRFPRVSRMPRPSTSRQTTCRGVADSTRSDRVSQHVA